MGLYSLFNLFKSIGQKLKSSGDFGKEEFIPYLLEDDYCQIEMVASGNLPFIKQQIALITDSVEIGENGLGFTNIFERGGMPFPTINEEIRVDALEKTLLRFKLPEARFIKTGLKKVGSPKTINTKAYGFHGFVVFFDSRDEFVKNIWLSINHLESRERVDIIEPFLYDFGKTRIEDKNI